MHRPDRVLTAVCVLAAVLVAVPAAIAQTFPGKLVRVIVPYSPGGSGDIMARVIGQRLAQSWGQQVIIENRPGANGMIGAAAAAKAVPDGYTLLLGYTSEIVINPSLYRKLAYDPAKELDPITMAGTLPLLLIGNPSFPAKGLKDLVALARARPGDVLYGSAGIGSPAHLGMEYLGRLTRTSMTHVTYKGGADAVLAVIGGQVMVFFSGIPPAIPHVQSGRLRALAVSTAARVAVLPNVPTVAESGAPGFDMTAWFGYFAPTGTPAEAVNRVAEGVGAALRDAQIVRQLEAQGIVVVEMAPARFSEFVRRDAQQYARIIREAGVALQ